MTYYHYNAIIKYIYINFIRIFIHLIDDIYELLFIDFDNLDSNLFLFL